MNLTLLFTGFGLLEFFYRYLDAVARNRPVNPLVPFLEEMTAAYGVLILFGLVIRPMAVAVRPDKLQPAHWVPRHMGALFAFSLLHTSWNWFSRAVIFPLAGLGSYDYGRMPVRYAMEFPSDVIVYGITVMVIVGLARTQEARERELRIAKLESDLARAQLEALSLQLQPHFLFNALNAVSAAMYEDPRKADMMLARVADFLRRMLDQPGAHEVPLAHELETLKLYLAVMQARFEDNLQVTWNVDASLDDAIVPPLLLQPLAENAIRHGVEPGSARITIDVGAATRNGSLILSVRDRGAGFAPRPDAHGIGLDNTRSRLGRLYGPRARLEILNPSSGGTEVRIELPLRRSAGA